jgi:hypothetical protein
MKSYYILLTGVLLFISLIGMCIRLGTITFKLNFMTYDTTPPTGSGTGSTPTS